MYTNEQFVGAIYPTSTNWYTAENVAASAAAYGEMGVSKNCMITRIYFTVTTAIVATSTAPEVAIKKYVKIGDSSGAVTVGTITIPNGTAAGTVMYKDVTPVEFAPGNSIVAEHTVQCVGGSVAGAGWYSFEIQDSPETPANTSAMLASA